MQPGGAGGSIVEYSTERIDRKWIRFTIQMLFDEV